MFLKNIVVGICVMGVLILFMNDVSMMWYNLFFVIFFFLDWK